MLTAVLLIKAKKWKQTNIPTDEWISKMHYNHTV